MVKKIFGTFIILSQALAFNMAQITVLEAPIFKEPDIKSKVVQYIRKGEKIPLHPAEILKDPYQYDINLDKRLVEKNLKNLNSNEKDPLFKNSPTYEPETESLFYKTSDNLGRDAWILKEHVFVLYEDTREFDQEVIKPDPTDYVLAEPLPKGYPLKGISGYRSYLSYGLGPNTRTSYPYNFKITDEGYDFDKSLEYMWVKKVSWDETERTFFGFHINYQSGSSQYSFDNGKAREDYSLLSVGPRLEHDVWKNSLYRINLNSTLQFSVMDEIEVKVNNVDSSVPQENKRFSAFQVFPTVGANIQKIRAIGNMDLIGGLNIFFHLPNSYKTHQKGNQGTWVDSNKFDIPFYANINFFLGIQATL